uniref:Uncharacterized protein n=1 Tax=Yersinia enterocolitica TaxID=630 RepID=B0RKZ7_YEREN|nr:hypothetical protein [Yersinia enterocolitica]
MTQEDSILHITALDIILVHMEEEHLIQEWSSIYINQLLLPVLLIIMIKSKYGLVVIENEFLVIVWA